MPAIATRRSYTCACGTRIVPPPLAQLVLHAVGRAAARRSRWRPCADRPLYSGVQRRLRRPAARARTRPAPGRARDDDDAALAGGEAGEQTLGATERLPTSGSQRHPHDLVEGVEGLVPDGRGELGGRLGLGRRDHVVVDVGEVTGRGLDGLGRRRPVEPLEVRQAVASRVAEVGAAGRRGGVRRRAAPVAPSPSVRRRRAPAGGTAGRAGRGSTAPTAGRTAISHDPSGSRPGRSRGPGPGWRCSPGSRAGP